MEVKRLVYVSRRAPELGLEDAIELITTAAERNAVSGITGFILMAPKFFLQVLEGDAEHVTETFGRIQKDPRHSDLEVLEEAVVEQRSFAQWSMGFASGGAERTALLQEAGIDDDTELPGMDAPRALELLSKLSQAA